MLRAIRITLLSLFAAVIAVTAANADGWVLHRSGVDRLPGSHAWALLDPEIDRHIAGGGAEATGYDSEHDQFFAEAFDNEWDTVNGDYASAQSRAYSASGLDDVYTTWCEASSEIYVDFDAGAVSADASCETDQDMTVYQAGSPTGTFSLTLSVSAGAGFIATGTEPSVEVIAGDAVAYAWIGDWEDASATGQYVAAGITLNGFFSWTYNPDDGYVEPMTTEVGTSYAFTGLTGQGQAVHFVAISDSGYTASYPNGGFTLGIPTLARCNATITPE